MTRRIAAIFGLCALAACGTDTTIPAGNLKEPVALATANAAGDAPVVFIANATDEDLRAFFPAKGLFARGPNAISPLSVDVGFRPTRLAAGAVGGHPFVAVAGATSQVALVDASADQTKLKRTLASTDRNPAISACPAGGPTVPGCLPGPATDVAASDTGTAAGVVVAPLATTPPELAIFATALENDLPVLTFGSVAPLTGQPAGVVLSADGTKAFIADTSAARVLEVTLPGGGTRDITAAGPTADVFLSPAYVAGAKSHPAGEFLLAILVDGRIQVLDPAAGGPPNDPNGQPVSPLSFNGTPARDIVFLPCPGSTTAACSTVLRTGTADEATLTVPGLGFVALGDGTAIAIQPDPNEPRIYRQVVKTDTPATATTPVLTVPGSNGRPTTPTMTAPVVTRGFTRSEAWVVTFRGLLPGFHGRAGTLSADGATLTDDDPTAFGTNPIAGDALVGVTTLAGTCSPADGVTVTPAGPNTLTLTPPLAGCGGARIRYDLQAGGATPWTVVGTSSGFVGRAASGPDEATAPKFTYAPPRFFYPPTTVNASGAPVLPQGTSALEFQIIGDATTPGTEFTFSTKLGLDAVVVGSQGLAVTTSGGLANAITAVPGRLYLAEMATSRLVQIDVGQLTLTGEAKTFQ